VFESASASQQRAGISDIRAMVLVLICIVMYVLGCHVAELHHDMVDANSIPSGTAIDMHVFIASCMSLLIIFDASQRNSAWVVIRPLAQLQLYDLLPRIAGWQLDQAPQGGQLRL
jgi:hypothetical protein